MVKYRITEADETERFVHSKNLAEAIGMARMPLSVRIEGKCPINPHHDFAPLSTMGPEEKTEVCRICGLTR